MARAEAIGDDLLRLTGTSLDKGVELDALAKLPGQYRDGDEKVLPRCFEHGWNAGASIGSFSPPIGSCFDWPKTDASFAVKSAHSLAGADTKLEGVGVKNAWGVSGRSTTVQRTLCLVHLARPNRDSDEMACQGLP